MEEGIEATRGGEFHAKGERESKAWDEHMPVAGELGELAGDEEDDEHEVCVAEHGDLLCLLEHTPTALGQRDLPCHGVLNAFLKRIFEK
jgi:hypothetical protein